MPASSKQPVNAGIASSLGPQTSLSIVTVTPTAVSTATPVATATTVPVATSTAAPQATATPAIETDVPVTDLSDEDEEEAAPTATPEPEATATPEPTATPQPTAVPATPTAVPATATPAVAVGVVITPASGAAATATPQTTALRAAGPVAATAAIPANGKVTPYADSLKGNTLGCNGYGPYDPADPTTAAVSDEVNDVPCGTKLQLCSSKTCITVERKDTCPGCAASHVDVSRRAFELLCGAVNDCTVTIKKQ